MNRQVTPAGQVNDGDVGSRSDSESEEGAESARVDPKLRELARARLKCPEEEMEGRTRVR